MPVTSMTGGVMELFSVDGVVVGREGVARAVFLAILPSIIPIGHITTVSTMRDFGRTPLRQRQSAPQLMASPEPFS